MGFKVTSAFVLCIFLRNNSYYQFPALRGLAEEKCWNGFDVILKVVMMIFIYGIFK